VISGLNTLGDGNFTNVILSSADKGLCITPSPQEGFKEAAEWRLFSPCKCVEM